MSAAVLRLGRSPTEMLALAVTAALAAAVGVFTGYNPALGVALAGALVFMLVALANLTLGVCLFLLVAFLDVVSQNQNLSVTKGAGAVLAVSWLATMATRRRARKGLTATTPWLVAALLGFVVWSAMSAFWAESPSATVVTSFRYALDVTLMPIAFWAIRERKHVVWIFGVFVLGTLLCVLWGIAAGPSSTVAAGQAGRLTGGTLEANGLALFLIFCTVFATAIALALRRRTGPRALAVLAAIAATVAFFATFSRGGLVALAAVLIASFAYAGRSRPAFVALVAGIVAVGAVFLHATTSDAVHRLLSTSTSGRSDIWKVGLRIVRANPIIGVGSGNFTVAEPHYLLATPGPINRADLILGTPYVAHNMYLQILAELGIVGLVLFLSVLVLSLRTMVQAVTLFRASGDRSMEILARALVVAMVGFLTASFFLSDQDAKQVWLLLALGPALLAIGAAVTACYA